MDSIFKVYRDVPFKIEIFKYGWIANATFLSFYFQTQQNELNPSNPELILNQSLFPPLSSPLLFLL
jgi:hypothetical protein